MNAFPHPLPRRFRLRPSLLALAASATLAACGGGGSGADDGVADAPIAKSTLQIAGVVVDGPIQGASVFLDLNGNLQRDADEPAAPPTDAQGAFRLDAPALAPDRLATAMLVAHVDAAAARDVDDGGLTLAQAGRPGVTLMTPASAYVHVDANGGGTASQAVVSPLTTLVAAEMATNGLTLAEARAEVQSSLGLGDRDPMANFVAGGDAGLGHVARVTATALGEAGRAVADAAREQGGLPMHEQVAEIMASVRRTVPEALRTLGLDRPDALRPSVPAMMGALKADAPDAGQARLSKRVADQRYVVVFRDDVGDPSSAADDAVRGHGGRVGFRYGHAIKGFSVSVPAAAADAFLDAMARNPNVDHVEIDRPMTASQVLQSPATWGLDRSDQRLLPLTSSYTYAANGGGVSAYVVDSGIRADHVDFGGRVGPGFTAIADGRGTTDCNGHGTHVAGTIGGTTYGIAKGVRLVPVRVIDCAGSGTSSTVIAGLDWVAANAVKPAVVNMSLGGGASTAVDNAVNNTVARGITVVVAAGNSGANACNYSPARAAAAITVGATTNTDYRASYSNYGTCLDVYAPGSSITSAGISSATATVAMSGTSMASPHVAGRAALALQASPAASPAQVADTIRTGATPNVLKSIGTGSPNLLMFTGDAVAGGTTSGGSTSGGTTSGGTTSGGTTATTTTVRLASIAAGAATVQYGWQAIPTITVTDAATGAPVAGAVVTGSFSAGGTYRKCTTGSTGFCRITSGTIPTSTATVRFVVNGIAGTNMVYDKTKNLVSVGIYIYRP